MQYKVFFYSRELIYKKNPVASRLYMLSIFVFTHYAYVCWKGKTIPQVAIKWLLQKDVVPSVVIGANSLQQLEDNISAAHNWKLSKEQVK